MRAGEWRARLDLHSELQEIYLHRFLLQLAKKLVAIFIPLFLLGEGFSPVGVMGFYLIYIGAATVATLPDAELAARFGYKKSSLMASPLLIAFYFLLREVSPGGPGLALAALTGGVGLNMYWMGMNPEMARSTDRENREKESGAFYTMGSLSAAIAPLLGGLFLEQSGFGNLLLGAATLTLLSFVPFVFTPEHREGMDLDFRTFLSDYGQGDLATHSLYGALVMGQTVVWPLYLAIKLGGALNIGGAGTVLALGSGAASLFAGGAAAKFGRARIASVTALLVGGSFLVMSIVVEPALAFAVSALNGIFFKAMSVPIMSSAIDHSRNSDVLEYYIVKDLALSAGKLLVLGLFAVFFTHLQLETAFYAAFGLLALLSVAMPAAAHLMMDKD